PSKGFPVAVPPKSAPIRVACLGASSTGGAFQNDSLDDFYPARMSHMRPPNTEIVNQGVGGWTSFHIRKYLEGHADTLDANIWTIYLGVNENLPTRMSFADLYDAWEAGSLSEGITALDNIRLFQGLRLFTRGLQPGAGAGVSPKALRDNLEQIIQLAQARQVKVLLMSEGVRPDPRILWHYAAVMSEVADESDDVVYLDTATLLDQVGDGAFIDSNHLTDLGHRTVAAALKAELTRLGWW
ncbi:MAG: SGNH/GDSL hydrolase family protein, partial [Phycisphaerales bacterium]|nr:SGNH/GDSL hydrolase family protein [Phycisphaerales bacterium]